jgi:hypothetical protein
MKEQRWDKRVKMSYMEEEMYTTSGLSSTLSELQTMSGKRTLLSTTSNDDMPKKGLTLPML